MRGRWKRAGRGGASRGPRLHSCGVELLDVKEYEVIPAGDWQMRGGQFVPVPGDDDGDQLHQEYRCIQCGGLLDSKEVRWFLGLKAQEPEE